MQRYVLSDLCFLCKENFILCIPPYKITSLFLWIVREKRRMPVTYTIHIIRIGSLRQECQRKLRCADSQALREDICIFLFNRRDHFNPKIQSCSSGKRICRDITGKDPGFSHADRFQLGYQILCSLLIICHLQCAGAFLQTTVADRYLKHIICADLGKLCCNIQTRTAHLHALCIVICPALALCLRKLPCIGSFCRKDAVREFF